jgi:hypothetical protein
LNNPLISGRVYAFDRTTGEPQWPTPAVIERHGLLLPQPSALPVLVFVRHVINPTAGGRNRTKTSLLCLDKRTGRAVFQKDDFAFGTGFFHLEGDRAANIVAVRLPSLAVKLHYTETPIPPEPPLQAGQGCQRPPKRALGVFGSMFRALGRAAVEVQGVGGDPFDQPGRPLGGPAQIQKNPGNNPFNAQPFGKAQAARKIQKARQNAQQEAQQNVQEEMRDIQEAAREAQEAAP